MVGGGGASAAKASSGGRVGVRIVVAGDKGTGKSSLIVTAAADTFPINVPPLLPPTRLPDDLYPDRVPVTIIDTSSSMENRGKLAEELKRADAVVLTYACDQPATLDRLSTFWLPELRRLEVKVPVIVVGCKLDLRDEQHPLSLEQVLSPIMQQFREIETCIECSAFKQIQVPEVFCYAQKAVLHPRAPLFDQEAQTLKPRCVRALKRIFILCDHDRDGALSDAELNDFQVKCFNAPLQPSEIVGVKRVVQEKLPEGVNDRGLTLTGFLVLHTLFIEKGRLETTWTVLRKFGYNNDIRLSDDQLPPPIKRAPDQSVELISEALDFLRGIFRLFDIDGDGALNRAELEDFFSTAPESPWDEAPFKDAAERTALGGLSLERFLSEAKGSHYLLAKPECNKDSTMCSTYNAVRFLYESLYIKHDYNAVRFLYEYLYIRHDRALIEAFNKDKLKAPNEIREEKALNTFAKAGANLDMKDATKQDPLETEASSQTPTKGGASPVLTLSPDLKEGLGGSGSLPSIAEHGHPAGSSPLQETEKSLSPTQSREGSSKAKFVAEIQVAIEDVATMDVQILDKGFSVKPADSLPFLQEPKLELEAASHTHGQPTIEGPEDGAQSALTKASEKTDLPEIIEEADMDELFESMKDIVTSTVSGTLGSGAGSSAQPTFGSEEVINAKETLKAALKMNIKNALHPGRTSTLREAIRVLIATKVLPSSADAALASFGHDFSTFNQNFEGITRDLQIVDEKLEEATVLTIEVSQKSAAWEILRPKIEANKKEKAEALKKIQEAEERLKSAKEELQQVEVRAKGYDDEKKEMFSRTRFSKTKLLVMDVQSLFSSREQLDLQFQGMVATWEGLRRNVFGHL